MIRDELVPLEGEIFADIETLFGHGVRRPGYPADRRAEGWIQERFRALGLEKVRAEPVELTYWKPLLAELAVTARDQTVDIPCFPLPHSAPAHGLEASLVPFDSDKSASVLGAVALYDLLLTRMPHAVLQKLAKWSYDPDGTFAASEQVLPFGPEMMNVTGPAIAAGASAFVGTLRDYPGDSCSYYVPYDAVAPPIPGVWVSGSDGSRLREWLAAEPVRARLSIDAQRETITCSNIVGELSGANEETVIVGSHHDGPWASAVEDASGVSLVLAQARYWSRIPRRERPHRMIFLLNAGHMAGGAGQASFVETHREELERAVLELHLEHAASEFAVHDGELRPTGHPEARWWFTSDIPSLEAAVRSAIEAEDIGRSLMLKPTVFGPKPTTDGANFFVAGVPIVNYLTAPFYLFDAMDTLDKIHRPSLVPVTRAAIRILESTAGRSAASLRAEAADQG